MLTVETSMFCPHCASPVQPGQTFCAACGQPIGPPPAPGAPAGPGPQPYGAPPAAGYVSAMPAAASTPADRPSSVRLALMLLAGTALLGVLMVGLIGLQYGGRLAGGSVVMMFLRSGFFAVLWFALIFCAWNRQNWARFVIVALVAWSAVTMGLAFARFNVFSSGMTPFSLLASLLETALRIWAATLLFRPESSTWFTRR